MSAGVMSRPGSIPGIGATLEDKLPCCELLRDAPLFAGLHDRDLAVVSPSCRRVSVRHGWRFVCEGQEAKYVYVLQEGQVSLEVELFMGNHLPPRVVEVEQVRPKGVFGLCALFEPRSALLSARCTEDADLIAVDVAELKARMKAHPAVGLAVMENVCRITRDRLMCAHNRVVNELGLAAMYAAHRNY
jgi:CRP-like cAMP-binding protein